ncbi:MAG: hypothetical protein COS56_03480, partial [Sulfurimonas sp. CG03_land_8_20_14_0_80_36_25]
MSIAQVPLNENFHDQIKELQQFALDTISEAVFILDANAQVIYANKSTCQYLNYSNDELLTMSVHDIDPNFPMEKWQEHWQKLKREKQIILKTHHKTKEGKVVPMEVCANHLEYNGIDYNMAFVKDFTEQLEKEEHQKNEQMRLFFERQLIGMAITSPEKKWLYANEKLCYITGYSSEELIKKTWEEMTHPKDLTKDLEQFERLLNGEIEEYILEKRFIHKDGTIIYTNLSVSCVRNKHNSIEYILAVIEDISERKRAEDEIKTLNAQLEKQVAQRGLQLEEAIETLLNRERKLLDIQHQLQETQTKLKAIISTIPDMVWLKDINGLYLACNPAHEEYCGKRESEIIGKTDYDFFTKESADICKVSDMNALTSDGVMISKEEIINPNDNTIRVLEVRKTPVNTSNGELFGVLGIGRDITKENQAKLQLEQEIAFSQGIINAIPDLLFETDREGTYLNVWTQKPELLVAPKETLLGKTINEILPSKAANVSMEAIKEADEKGFSFGKIFSISFETTTFWFELSISKIAKNTNRFLIISRDITERKTIENKMKHMAHHDSLTGLPNRIIAKAKGQEAIHFAQTNSSKVALLFLDLDGFKTINDSLGHSVGDTLLQIIASRIKNTVAKHHTISRQGGDEFLVILSDINAMEDVLPILEQLLCKFEKPFTIDTHVLSTSTSIGVALYPEHGNTFEQLLQNADTAMYKAKENGKNTYCFYAEQMNIDTAREFQIQNDLKKAIANSEFVLYYQPQIDLELNRITGAEALIRWKRPELGMVPPMDFIPLAEATGLIVPIGEWVIMEACRQAALWAKKGVELTIAVNISAVQFKRGDLEDVVKRALSISKLNPKLLELELTESVMVHDIEIILATVQRLKLLGIQLSIDDFGTGYSSLSYLKRFAVDKLKIDQSFVRDILIDD